MRATGLPVGDEYHLAQSGGDGGGGVANVEEERTTAHGGGVDVGRSDTQVVGDGDRREPRSGDAIDVGHLQAGVGHGQTGGLGVHLQGGHVGHDADALGLCRADNGGLGTDTHCALPTGRKTGTLWSPRDSKATSRGMSSTRASGVLSTPTMLVIIRGPSSNRTTAMA